MKIYVSLKKKMKTLKLKPTPVLTKSDDSREKREVLFQCNFCFCIYVLKSMDNINISRTIILWITEIFSISSKSKNIKCTTAPSYKMWLEFFYFSFLNCVDLFCFLEINIYCIWLPNINVCISHTLGWECDRSILYMEKNDKDENIIYGFLGNKISYMFGNWSIGIW